SSGRVSAVRISWRHGRKVLSGSAVQAGLELPSTWFWVRGAGAAPRPGGQDVTRGSLPPPPASDWPAGRPGWTVVLQAVPESAGEGAAKADAAKARAAGLPRVGVLVSDELASL